MNPFWFAALARQTQKDVGPVLNDTSDPASHEFVFKHVSERGAAPPHPGEILREDIFPELGLTKAALAKILEIATRRLGNLIAERAPVTIDLALRLGTVLGHGPRYWLGLQMQHDIWLADQPLTLKLRPLDWKRPSRKPARAAANR